MYVGPCQDMTYGDEGDGSEGQHLHGVAGGPVAGELWTRRRRLVGKQKDENGGERRRKEEKRSCHR